MRCSSSPCWLVAATALVSFAPAHAAENKPIVAVFTVEAKGVALDASMLDRLSAYLAGSVAATGRYQVVPRDQLKQRLVQQKAASYRGCYDRSCQIEIGKELAAQKSLATQVIKLGTKCALTGTLFDLRRAAAERAATARGGCSEDEIVASLETMVKRLAPPAVLAMRGASSHPASVGQQARQPATRGRFAVDFRSRPPGAGVFLDGRAICTTNCRENLAPGRYELQLERNNRLTHKQQITVKGREVLDVHLRLSPEGRQAFAERTEFLTLEGLIGTFTDTEDGGLVGGGVVHAVTIKWPKVFWSVLEVGFFTGGEHYGVFMLSRAGYPLYFGERGQHQVRFGLGVGGGGFLVSKGLDATNTSRSSSSAAFVLNPTAEYRFLTDQWLNVGVGARFFLPLGDFSQQPFALLLSLVVGFQSPGYLL